MSQPLSFCHWSGKLLCALNLYRAQQQSKVLCLVNLPGMSNLKMTTERIPSNVLRQLADSLKLPLFTPIVTQETLQDDLMSFFSLMRQKYEVQSVILNHLKNRDNSLNILESFYGQTSFQIQNFIQEERPEELFVEAINLGFKAYIFSINEKFFSRNYLGSLLTLEMLENFKKNNVHPFGLHGEFDAICVSGPNFENKIGLTFGDIHFKNGYWYREFMTHMS